MKQVGPVWAPGSYQRQRPRALPVQATALLRRSIGCQSPLLLTAHQLPASATPPCCGITLQDRWAPCSFSACIRGWAVQGGCHQRSGWFQRHCLSKCQQWSPRLRAVEIYPRTGSPLLSTVGSFPWIWLPQIQGCTGIWSGEGWSIPSTRAGGHGEGVAGKPAAARADPSLLSRGGNLCACLSSSGVQAPHSPYSSPSSPPIIQGDSSLHTGCQDCEAHRVVQTAYSSGWISTHMWFSR